MKDQEQMAVDRTRAVNVLGGEKVLEAVKDSLVLPRHHDVLPISDPLLQKR